MKGNTTEKTERIRLRLNTSVTAEDYKIPEATLLSKDDMRWLNYLHIIEIMNVFCMCVCVYSFERKSIIVNCHK